MCGIFFLDLGADGVDPSVVVAEHAQKLAPRGPDASAWDVLCEGRYLLAFHRLAIIATNGSGMQPIRRRGMSLICSGEVYNHCELGNTPGEVDVGVIIDVLLDCQEIPDAVACLDGDYAFVAVEEASGRVVAARDPLGVRPLFQGISATGAVVAFASEAKALVGAPGIADVLVFPPGHAFVDGKLLPYSSKPSQPGATCRQLLERAIEKRLKHSERPVALLCSGGIDSAAMLSIATRIACTELPRVYTMRYSTGQSDDAFYAEMLCSRLGCPHEVVSFGLKDLCDETLRAVIRVCETCDPNTIRAALPMYLLAKHIAQTSDIKVVLSGEGADELFGGYGYFRFAPTPKDAADECGRLLNNIHMFDLLRADRCFAAHGLEVRVPFLDRDLIDGVSALVPALRMRGEKQLLRDSVSDLGELAALRILDRPKEKFSDGTGFSYVPDLLRRIAADWGENGDEGTLSSRLVAERHAYTTMFEEEYGAPAGRWVVKRTMPSWVDGAVKAGSESASGCQLAPVTR